jgi:hypothetical protein
MRKTITIIVITAIFYVVSYQQKAFANPLSQTDFSQFFENVQKTQSINNDLAQTYQYIAKNNGVNNINYTCFKELSRVHNEISSHVTQTYYILIIYGMMVDIRDEITVSTQLKNQIDMFEKIMHIERNVELPVIRNACNNGNVTSHTNRMLDNWDKLSNIYTNLKIKIK